MLRFLLPLLVLLAGESAALACSCRAPPTDWMERRVEVLQTAEGALALVEVEVLAAYDERLAHGERVQVRRTLAGRARTFFEVERRRPPNSTACDVELQPGQRVFALLYEARFPATAPEKRYRISDLCTALRLRDKKFRRQLVQRMRFHIWK